MAQPLVAAKVHELATSRCSGCGKVFSASPPAEAGEGKFDPNVGPLLAVQRYGYGNPAPRSTITERALKMAIRHRNNSLFYKTLNGAHIGDMFMSLIHTCRFCEAAPFHYLVTLRKYAKHLAENPAAWMPWNYKSTLDSIAGG